MAILECPNKHTARLQIWAELTRFRHPPLTRVLLMPGATRYELDLVFAKGYKFESSVFLVEYNPAVWANLTRRSVGKSMPPKENQLHMLLSEAGIELVRRGIHLDVVHLDFCSNVEGHRLMTTELLKFLKSGVMAAESLIAISWLKGREHYLRDIEADGHTIGLSGGHQSDAGQGFLRMSVADRGRVYPVHKAFYEALGVEIGVVKFGSYQNTRTRNPMLWAIFHLKQQPKPEAVTTAMRSLTKTWIPPQERATSKP